MAIEKLLRWTVIVGIFALPFIIFIVADGFQRSDLILFPFYPLNADNFFFPFITGKNFAFRIIVEIITGAWLALALIKPEYRPKKSWLLGAFAIFTIIIALADATGVNPFKSFWSNYERMDGWVTLAHLFLYFVVASSILSTRKLWRRLWLTSLGVSVFSAFMGLSQLFGVSALGQGGASGLAARLDSTFGNPIYLAVFMLFNIFIAAFLFAESWRESKPGRRLGISFGYGSIIALDTIILLLTGTRGTTLGLVGGALLALLIYAFFNQGANSIRLRVIAIGSIVVVAIMGVGLWLAKDTAFVNSVGFLDRLSSISIEDNTTKSRFMNWGMAWQGVKERPILGWGQENYAIVFDKYYNPNMFGQEQWFDRVHNIVFDWLVAGGFLGLIGYLMLYFCALWCVWSGGQNNSRSLQAEARDRDVAVNTEAFSTVEKSILTGLLAGYFFHNLFVFDNISSYILFTTILAYIASRFAETRDSPTLLPSVQIPYSAMSVIAVIAVIAVFGTAWEVNGKALAQNRALLKAISPQMSINVFEIGARNFWPNEPESHITLAAAYYATGNPSEAIAQLEKAGKLATAGAAGSSLKDKSDTLIQEVNKTGIGDGVPEHVTYFKDAIKNIKKKAKEAIPNVGEQLKKAEQAQGAASPSNVENIKKQISDMESVMSVLSALAGSASDVLIREVQDKRPRGLLRNLEYYKESIAYGAYGIQEAREQLVQVSSRIAGNQQIPSNIREEFRALSENEMDLQQKMSPMSARFPLFLGILYKSYGDIENAEKSFARAHELSPGKQVILFELGANAQSRGNNEEALRYFKEAYELAPEFTTARIYYASTLIRFGQESAADEVLAPMMQSGVAADPNIASAYVARGRYDKIAEIWRARVKAVPGDMQARFTLSAALVGAGQPAQAIAELDEVKAIDPSAKAQVDEFIKQIQSGSIK
ncbi:hypothetical protein A3C86_03910 [Candidatus Kaiserbacteria bacterium RIFCSPHIGHO2_02_FULL_49_16]|uniref:O-antigen ligase-related domain-containing protein n=1 Tax=Candidatus Kaiserbacteria bacterium RIFCSPHIGHO2_02_FULL_49_16 TaxID=1798490 RepID=A0A1F6DDS0_9BACT|nr:MAG: hypothetical protein A3C86_03910 [Candidatus Kaiserbacteria bacterium RIFCSPHIGHO2_02_FULL_49_16]